VVLLIELEKSEYLKRSAALAI